MIKSVKYSIAIIATTVIFAIILIMNKCDKKCIKLNQVECNSHQPDTDSLKTVNELLDYLECGDIPTEAE